MTHAITLGLMSGTSLDGIDAVAVDFGQGAPRLLGHVHLPFDAELTETLIGLCTPGDNEIDRMGNASMQLAEAYAESIRQLMHATSLTPDAVMAAGVHGQTVRHRPEWGWTLQLNNPARIAELTGVDIIADFRSRDMAAGGQGAPLVPAFHQRLFADPTVSRCIVNIGGIANVTVLPASTENRPVIGFDCGPGNTLMDAWTLKHVGKPYDADGRWGASGTVNTALLAQMLADPFFAAPPPKSTGREYFHTAWIDAFNATIPANDLQATLRELTATSIADSIRCHAPNTHEVYVCGGGALNPVLMQSLAAALGPDVTLRTTDALGVDPMHVEAMAFAWLAHAFCRREPGNLPDVTNAIGPRPLGALYPA